MTLHRFLRHIPTHTSGKRSSFVRTSDAAAFADAWCTAVRQLNGAQLRDHGKQLLDVWFEYVCASEPDEEDTACRNSLALSSYGTLLSELASQDRPARQTTGTPFDRRIAWLAGTFELNATERATIWIMNNPQVLDGSLLRRMSLAIEFPVPPRSVRQRVVERHARTARIKLAGHDLDRLASISAAPAVVGNALACAKAAGGGASEALTISEGLLGMISGEVPVPDLLPPCYNPDLALADVDLDELASRLGGSSDPRWSLLLSGPSGTGKSAYARHLADRLGLDLLIKRGSDLLSAFVGMTEANIADAFREAARGRCLLLIDEADDFLADRQGAQRSWERTMVNQMLRQMEALESPLVATTNASELLDPATQRRFTLRVGFRVLDERRAAAQFRRWFGVEIPQEVRLIAATPGDFALVARRAQLLSENDPRQLARWLHDEAEARGSSPRPIGFVA